MRKLRLRFDMRMRKYCALAHIAAMDPAATPSSSESRRGKRRLRYEEEWTKKKRKHNKDAGKAYITYKGEQRSEKQPTPTLTCKCAYLCREKVNDEERERNFISLLITSTKINICMD